MFVLDFGQEAGSSTVYISVAEATTIGDVTTAVRGIVASFGSYGHTTINSSFSFVFCGV